MRTLPLGRRATRASAEIRLPFTPCIVLALSLPFLGCSAADTSSSADSADSVSSDTARAASNAEAELAPSGPVGEEGALPLADAAGCIGTPELRPGTERTLQIRVGSQTRSYVVHVGRGVDATSPAALVVNFHGMNNSPSIQANFSQMDSSADRNGYVVAYPQGIGSSFNAGGCCGSAQQRGVDDVAFARRLVEDVSSRLCVDAKRVYATGFSNGGYMSYRLACEAADLFAAIAPVAGANGMSRCSPSRPVPMIAFNGTIDNIVPYASGKSSAAAWARRNGCEGTPTRKKYGSSYCEEWTRCSSGAPVTHCSVSGLWHFWPGASSAIPATAAIWSFFEQHALP